MWSMHVERGCRLFTGHEGCMCEKGGVCNIGVASSTRYNIGGARVLQGKEAPFRRQYIIRVLIPCYKESLAIIQRTVLAAKRADRPPGTRMVIYVCDDGNDEKKLAWIQRIDDPEVCPHGLR